MGLLLDLAPPATVTDPLSHTTTDNTHSQQILFGTNI